MKSITTTTTTSELDTLSEGNLTSNEMLEWGIEGGEGEETVEDLKRTSKRIDC